MATITHTKTTVTKSPSRHGFRNGIIESVKKNKTEGAYLSLSEADDLKGLW
jgi:hypothetical protein